MISSLLRIALPSATSASSAVDEFTVGLSFFSLWAPCLRGEPHISDLAAGRRVGAFVRAARDLHIGIPILPLGVMRGIYRIQLGIAKFVQQLKTLKHPWGTIFFIPFAAWSCAGFGLLAKADFSTNSCNFGQG
jgi:hypothetical protein